MPNPRGNPQNLRPWVPGQSGNPQGRSLARTQLDNEFIGALLADVRAHGVAAIETCRQKHPSAYLSIIGRTLPKELSVEVTRHEANDRQRMDAILETFSRLQRERTEAVERLSRIEGAVEGQISSK
jgi:hypothetical protein